MIKLLLIIPILIILSGCDTQNDLKYALKKDGYSDNCIDKATLNDGTKYITNDNVILATVLADGCQTRELIQSLKDK